MIISKKKSKKKIRYILEHLREEDKHECIVQKGQNYVKECLKDIINNKDYFVIACDKNNTPVAMGGCVSTNEQGVGVGWLLSTPEIRKHQISFIKNLKKQLNIVDKKYWFLFNVLYKENEIAKKWLKKCGFKFNIPLFGVNIPKDFEFFYRTREIRGLR